MRIAHFARACYPFHPYGGMERHVYHLTLELARLGHQVQLYTQPPDPSLPNARIDDPCWQENVRHIHVPYHTVKYLRLNSIPDRLVNYPVFSLRLGQRVRRSLPAPQIVHAHGLSAFGYALRSLPGVPLVLNPHGMEEFKNRSRAKTAAYAPFRFLLRQAARHASAIIATDEALIPEVERNLKAPAKKIRLIPNAVALDELDAEAARADKNELFSRFGLTPERLYLMLSVGRLEANKGFEVMLKALSQARTELDKLQPDWRWLIVGTGGQETFLKQETERMHLSDRVVWAGKLSTPDLHALYDRAALFVHPTLYEGSSLVTLEALAHSLPVVASATGGLPDKVFESGPYEDGRLCPPGEAAALAARLIELAVMPGEKRRQLGTQGRKLVEDRFSWKAAAQQTVELYRELQG
ncbi:MAG TPA: glycosyltransferase family 4 protein [Chloroflexia bacterium]|nr:glycosyltransferase family 4 protein [Chloroflexia bacterium]